VGGGTGVSALRGGCESRATAVRGLQQPDSDCACRAPGRYGS
jgi:hypothetical protein